MQDLSVDDVRKKLSFSLEPHMPVQLKVKKVIHMWPVNFTATASVGVKTVDNLKQFTHDFKFSCKDQYFDGKFLAFPKDRVIEYRKNVPVPQISEHGRLMVGARWNFNDLEKPGFWKPTLRVGFQLGAGGARMAEANTIRIQPKLFPIDNFGIQPITDIQVHLPETFSLDLRDKEGMDQISAAIKLKQLNLICKF